VRDLFVVNDLKRLTEYGFKPVGGNNRKGWATYKKVLGKMSAYQSRAVLQLIVNPYQGAHENELFVQCISKMDENAWNMKDEPVIWSFEEIGQLVRDAVVDWVESTPS